MNRCLVAVIIIALMALSAYCQSIVDFTYSEYEHEGKKKAGGKGDITIKPNRQII